MGKYRLVFGAFQNDRFSQQAIDILRERGFCTLRLERSSQIPGKIILVLFISAKENLRKGKILCCSAHVNHVFLHEKDLPTPFVIVCDKKAHEKGEEFEKAVVDIAKNYLRWVATGFAMDMGETFPPWGEIPVSPEKQQLFQKWVNRVKEYLAPFFRDYQEYLKEKEKLYERKISSLRI